MLLLLTTYRILHYYIIINILLGYAFGALHNVEPQYSPLTPYQTEDSLPPPVYGVLEKRPDLDASLIAAEGLQVPKSLGGPSTWRAYGTTKENGEIPVVPPKKVFSSSSGSSLNNAQPSKNWKAPPGAKLIGYNMQLIAGYIPTTYLEKTKRKKSKGDWKTRKSEALQDNHSKQHPGYSMNKRDDRTYRGTTKNGDLGIDNLQADWMGDELDYGSYPDTDFTRNASRFLEKREDFTLITTTGASGTTAGSPGLVDTLWPPAAAELEDEEEEEQSTSDSEMNHRTTENSGTTVAAIDIDTSSNTEPYATSSQDGVSTTTTVASNLRDVRDRLDREKHITAPEIIQSTLATNDIPTASSRTVPIFDSNTTPLQLPQVGSERASAPWETIQQNKGPPADIEFNQAHQVPRIMNAPEVPQQGIIFPQEPVSLQQGKVIDKPRIQPTTPIPERSTQLPMPDRFPKPAVPQIPPRISIPETIIHSTSVPQNNIWLDRPPAGTIIPIGEEPYGPETASIGIQKQPNIRPTTSAALQTLAAARGITSTPATAELTTTFNVDSAEFADEDYDKAVGNMDGSSSARPVSTAELETPKPAAERFPNKDLDEGQSAEASAPEQDDRRTTDPDRNSGNGKGGDEYQKPIDESEPPESNKDNDDVPPRTPSRVPFGRGSSDENPVGEDNGGGRKEDFRGKGDDNDNPREANDGDQETPRTPEDNDEGQEGAGAIPFPEQIPSFQDWLSSLPIQPGFPFGANSDGAKGRPPIPGGMPIPFPGQFGGIGGRRPGGKNGGGGREGRRPIEESEEERRPAREYNYDDSGEQESRRFQKQRFALPRNVPYR